MKTKSKFKAFSIIEVLIVMTMIGFIVIVEMVIMQTKINQYGNPYYTAYNALKKSAYNILADIHCPDPDSEDEACQAGPRAFPIDNPQALCNRLTEFINTAQVPNCDLPAIENSANINPDQPHFIGSNSFRFYVGEYNQSEALDIRGNSVGYYVIYVDINGPKRPNRITCEPNVDVLPDIVPFALTNRGEVIPMGYPIYSKTYITAKVIYPSASTTNEDGSISITNDSSKSMSFYEAAYISWPNGEGGDLTRNMDIPFSADLSNDAIYNESNINQCTSGVAGFSTIQNYKDRAIVTRNQESGMDADGNRTGDASDCTGGTFNCRVVIDSSADTRF